MNNIIKYGNFNGIEKNTNKKQIILTHSSRNADDWFKI